MYASKDYVISVAQGPPWVNIPISRLLHICMYQKMFVFLKYTLNNIPLVIKFLDIFTFENILIYSWIFS